MYSRPRGSRRSGLWCNRCKSHPRPTCNTPTTHAKCTTTTIHVVYRPLTRNLSFLSAIINIIHASPSAIVSISPRSASKADACTSRRTRSCRGDDIAPSCAMMYDYSDHCIRCLVSCVSTLSARVGIICSTSPSNSQHIHCRLLLYASPSF